MPLRPRQLDPVRERLLRGTLRPDVDRQAKRIARRGTLRLDLAGEVAERVDPLLVDPGRPEQVRVVRGLDAGLSDAVTGDVALMRGRGRRLDLRRGAHAPALQFSR